MNVNAWLTINNRGSVKVTKTQPGIDWNEVSIKINVDLPDELFRRPRLKASITIPKEAAITEEINAKTIEDCKEAIKTVTGLEMNISVIKHEEEPKE